MLRGLDAPVHAVFKSGTLSMLQQGCRVEATGLARQLMQPSQLY